MERVFKIEAFRNMGFKDEKPCATELLLNESAEKGHLGNLLTVVGANNVGKSNVLDAIAFFSDVIRFTNIKPSSYRIQMYKISGFKDEEQEFLTKEGIKSFDSNDFTDLYFDKTCKSPCLTFCEQDSDEGVRYAYKKCSNKGSATIFFIKSHGEYKSVSWSERNIIVDSICCNNVCNSLRDSHLIVKIIRYKDMPIRDEELEASAKEIETSRFFKALFHATETSLEDVKNAFDSFLERKDKNIFIPIKNQINEGLKPVSAKFNQLYMSETFSYSFEIDFDRQGLYLTMKRNGNAFVLSKQSDGFRYFFDMFFNLLNTTELNAGDIIIMDEPATNLHVKGQRELRDFLKRFAINNDITIIVATHLPFMIDTDNLDDVRVVVSDGEVSRIENNFAAVDPTDPDSLLPIKEALTVENYMLVNPKEKVVFVPTMEDYCYLVAFKKLFKIQGISFLPVNGISEDAESCKTVAKRLMQIRSDSFILVNDDEAGKCMKDVCKESDFTVFTLSEVDKRFSTIPALFAEGDKPADSASTFKNYLDTYTVNDESRANFKKLFDYLISEAE